jgi:hypothetical protein
MGIIVRLTDKQVLDDIAEILRNPDWAVGMLEDIALLVSRTNRTVENYPDNRSTWSRH